MDPPAPLPATPGLVAASESGQRGSHAQVLSRGKNSEVL